MYFHCLGLLKPAVSEREQSSAGIFPLPTNTSGAGVFLHDELHVSVSAGRSRRGKEGGVLLIQK